MFCTNKKYNRIFSKLNQSYAALILHLRMKKCFGKSIDNKLVVGKHGKFVTSNIRWLKNTLFCIRVDYILTRRSWKINSKLLNLHHYKWWIFLQFCGIH